MVKPIDPIGHVNNAAGNFLSQYDDSPVFKGFVNSFLGSLDDIEVQLGLFKTILSLSASEGVNLDLWGNILQAGTRPTSDDDFRVLLFALIGAYYSEGLPEDVRALMINLITASSYEYLEFGKGVFSFGVIDPIFTFDPLLVSSLVQLAKPSGTEFIGFVSTISPYYGFEGDPFASTFSVTGGQEGGFYSILIL
jgi:hypothetical protein